MTDKTLINGDRNAKNEPSQAQNPSGQFFSLKPIAVGCILLLVLTPWVFYLNDYQPPNGNGQNIDLEHYISEVSDKIINYALYDATALLQDTPGYATDIQGFENKLNQNLENKIETDFQPYSVPGKGIEVTVDYSSLKIQYSYQTTNDLTRYPGASEADQHNLDIYKLGEYRDTTIPYSYQLSGDISLIARKFEDKNLMENKIASVDREIYFEEQLPTPYLFMEYKLQQFQNLANTGYSDLSRTMNYMLNTLARVRVINSDVFLSQHSYKNILNEGDVELCLNLALLLEEALIFRAFDQDVIDEIDQNFFYAENDEFPNNPTGRRQWGTAEVDNYNEYITWRSSANNQVSRRMSSLVNNYVSAGFIDPADLVSLYLIMDQAPEQVVIRSVKDSIALLQEPFGTQFFMDPRTPSDNSDFNALKCVLPLSGDHMDGFRVGEDESETEPERQYMKLMVDQVPNYLVYDGDFKVTGIDTPRGWYTTAFKRPGTRLTGRTRTPSVVPEPPKDHAYRLEWDINIQGKIDLNLISESGVFLPDEVSSWHKKEISFKFPVNVYTWFDKDPKLESVEFTNLNSGKVDVATNAWEITTESHMVEYFESDFWRYLKSFFSLGFDGIYSIIPSILSDQGLKDSQVDSVRYLDRAVTNPNSLTNTLITDVLLFQSRNLHDVLTRDRNNLWLRFDTFMTTYFMDYLRQFDEEYGLLNFTNEPQFPHPPLVPWISVLGHEISLLYNQQTNVLEVSLEHSNGEIKLQIYGYNTSKEQLIILLSSTLNLPGVINLTTLVSSDNQDSITGANKANIWAYGKLFDKYQLTLKSYPRPDQQSNPIPGSSSTEKFLLTRLKFGIQTSVVTLELPELSLTQSLKDVLVEIELLIPETEAETVSKSSLPTDLESVLSTTELTRPVETTDNKLFREKLLHGRVYTAQLLHGLGEELLDWFQTPGQSSKPKFALRFSISSSAQPANDHSNLTVYLTEPQSTEKFIQWLRLNGLELVLALSNPETLITTTAGALTKGEQHLTNDQLSQLDFEIFNQKLDNELQINMNLGDNLLTVYDYPTWEEQNITSLIALSGAAMVEVTNGLGAIDTDQITGAISYSQTFYTYQKSNLPAATIDEHPELLIGIQWIIEGN
jgi:hypothetical protein